MEFINIDKIIFRHLIKFDYNTSKALSFKVPHHLFKIEDSIHFKTLKSGDFTDYNKLITTTNQKEHSEKIFKDLIKNFDVNIFETDKMRVFYDKSINKYIVKDGCHRLAIIKYNGLIEEVPITWFNIG